MKECVRCLQVKTASEFTAHKATKDRLDSWCKQCHTEYRKENKEAIRKINARYRERHKEAIKQRNRNWETKNQAKLNAKEAARRARKLKATPKWADLAAIKRFYENCPKGYEVDHIVPLKGKEICGLHVLGNLQYLPTSENRRKGNKYAII